VTSVDVLPQQISAGDETTVSFRAAAPGTVVFTLTRLEPDVRKVGRFGVRSRPGTTEFLFPGRIDRRLLRPGRYRLSARAAGAVFVVTRRPAQASDARAPGRGDGLTARPFVVAALVAAIALLGFAALPAAAALGPRAAEVLASRRSVAAAAGGLTLTVAFALYLLGVV
jgi:hypothetical protein